MFKAVLIVVGVMCMGFATWLLTPPKNVIGSVLPDWDTSYRQNKLIRDEDQQDEDLGFI
jgi:hypothetical protein